MKKYRVYSRSFAVTLMILVISFLLVSCAPSKEKKAEINDFHYAVSALSEYSLWHIEDELSAIRRYLDDSEDYEEISRAEAQKAYETIEAFLDELDQELNSFVSDYEDYSW